jgi:hypothetical protein
MPAKVSVSARARVAAGFARLIEDAKHRSFDVSVYREGSSLNSA